MIECLGKRRFEVNFPQGPIECHIGKLLPGGGNGNGRDRLIDPNFSARQYGTNIDEAVDRANKLLDGMVRASRGRLSHDDFDMKVIGPDECH